eukprot:TRINITY_DN1559_c0_g1_i2.p1 TRINITY_DN1559_c0_g1~~TRINITY_DN1559_c0_g1_i2.p1  ORF type:complete len:324 (-),score=16.00 TRINITY_DN1559_c0_g1_i2:63-1034(-)
MAIEVYNSRHAVDSDARKDKGLGHPCRRSHLCTTAQHTLQQVFMYKKDWETLWAKYWPANNRTWKSSIGCEVFVVEKIWNTYLAKETKFEKIHLLWALYFLRQYPVGDVGHCVWKVSKPTYEKWIWKIDFEERKRPRTPNSIFSNAFLCVDVTECTLEKPTNRYTRNMFYSGKSKAVTLKYEVAVSVDSGQICWVSECSPGTFHDATILQHQGLLDMIGEDEVLIADKAYVGYDMVYHPYKSPKTREQLEWNKMIGSIRVVNERAIRCFKLWNCLSHNWRHEICLHPIVFKVIAHIVHIMLEYSPLQKPNKWLSLVYFSDFTK